MKSQTLGSGLLVAGTSIGAGMLALPLIAALSGFGWGVMLMLFSWGLATYGGLLIAEACRACPEAKNLHSVIGRLMGPLGQGIAVTSMLFLYYSLSAAYITGGATVLDSLLVKEGVTLSFSYIAILLVGVVAALVVSGTWLVDVVNRVLFVLMLVLLLYILLRLLPAVSMNRIELAGSAPAMLLAAVPVLYTSFGYHCAVPTVVQYVDGKPHRFRTALIGGSALPFLIYVIWMLVVIGVVSSTSVAALAFEANGVTSMLDAIGEQAGIVNFDYIITAFAACALGTSFLGVALGLFDYLADVFSRSCGVWGRIETITLTLLIPLLAAIFLPGSFVSALGYAAIALVVLAVFIPVALVLTIRKQQLQESYQVAGGIHGLVIAVICGIFVIGTQLGIISGLLPTIG